MEEQHLTKTQERELRREEKEQHRSDAVKAEQWRRYRTTGIVVLIIGLFVVLVVWQKNQPAVSLTDTFSDPIKGNADASVVLREFSDLQCPACKAAQPMVKQIVEEFKDKIKFVYEDFPLPSHKNGLKAAEAGQCAYEEGKFFEFQEKVFAEQDSWASLSNPVPNFVEFAGGVGLDKAEFQSCIDSGRGKAAVDEDLRQGRSLQVAGTPSFFVNDELVSIRTINDLRQAIQSALGEGGSDAAVEENAAEDVEVEILNTNSNE